MTGECLVSPAFVKGCSKLAIRLLLVSAISVSLTACQGDLNNYVKVTEQSNGVRVQLFAPDFSKPKAESKTSSAPKAKPAKPKTKSTQPVSSSTTNTRATTSQPATLTRQPVDERERSAPVPGESSDCQRTLIDDCKVEIKLY